MNGPTVAPKRARTVASGSAGSGRPPRSRERKRRAHAPGRSRCSCCRRSSCWSCSTSTRSIYAVRPVATHDGALLETGDFVGLQNYIDVLHAPAFWKAGAVHRSSSRSSGCSAPGSSASGWRCCCAPGSPAGGLFKVLLLLPWVVPIVVSSTAWNWLVATPTAPSRRSCRRARLRQRAVPGRPACSPQIIVCIFKVWISFPFMMMMISAGAGLGRHQRLRGRQHGRRHRLAAVPGSPCR